MASRSQHKQLDDIRWQRVQTLVRELAWSQANGDSQMVATWIILLERAMQGDRQGASQAEKETFEDVPLFTFVHLNERGGWYP